MIFIKFYNIVDSEYLSLLFTQEVKLEQNVQHNRRDDHFLRSIPRQCRFFLCCSRYGAQLRKYAPHMYLTLQHTLGHLQQKFRRSDHGLLNDNKSPENSGFRQGFQVTPLNYVPRNIKGPPRYFLGGGIVGHDLTGGRTTWTLGGCLRTSAYVLYQPIPST